jgi:streptogramin lyase
MRRPTPLLTLAAGSNRIWVGDTYAGAVVSVDPRTTAVATTQKLPYVSDVAVGEGAVWATVDSPSELVPLDPSSGRPIGRPLLVPGTASGMTIGFGSIWVITGNGVVRVQP